MTYTITRQIHATFSIEASTAQEAIEKVRQGQGENIAQTENYVSRRTVPSAIDRRQELVRTTVQHK